MTPSARLIEAMKAAGLKPNATILQRAFNAALADPVEDGITEQTARNWLDGDAPARRQMIPLRCALPTLDTREYEAELAEAMAPALRGGA